MRHPIAIAATLVLAALPAQAQSQAQSQAQRHAYAPPRLADGTTPDLRGIWQARDTAYLNIEGHPAAPGIAASPSIVTDPPDHKIPYRPDALAQRAKNAANAAADPAQKCYEAGIPRATYLPTPFQIAQSVGPHGGTAFVYQDNHSFRIVYPASHPHTEGIDWWMGDSRGHWEGDTLVVDATTFNDLSWLDAAGNQHSNSLHVIERYTRTSPDTIRYTARIEDPATYTRPWTLTETLSGDSRPTAHIAEDECLDDRNGVRHHISPTDPRNLQRSRYTRWAIAKQFGLLTSGADVSTPPGQIPGSTSGAPPHQPSPSGPVPRLADGHPDFNGIWRSVPDVGRPPKGGTLPPFVIGRPGDDSSRDFAYAGVPRLPYTLAGFQEQMWRGRHQFLDGEPRCHLAGIPRAMAQPPYPQQIIQDDRSLAILYEYVHELRTIPVGIGQHPKNYSAWDGDSRAHWDGDTLVVDVADFNGRTWLNMTGNFVDNNEHVVERYTFIDPNKTDLQITVTDPGVFTKPFTFKLTMTRQAPDEQILEYACLEGEGDRQHYTEQFGGTQHAVAASAQATAGAAAPAAAAPPDTWVGCLRAAHTGRKLSYQLQTAAAGTKPLAIEAGAENDMVALIDREVLLSGRAAAHIFDVRHVQVLSEGCNATFD